MSCLSETPEIGMLGILPLKIMKFDSIMATLLYRTNADAVFKAEQEKVFASLSEEQNKLKY